MDTGCEIWNVFSCIALTREYQRAVLFPVVRVHFQEILKKLKELISRLLHRSQQLTTIPIAEPRANRLIDVKNVGNIEPGPSRVPLKYEIIIGSAVSEDLQGAVLSEESEHAGRTWSTVDPDDQGHRVISCLVSEEPVEKVVMSCGARLEGPRIKTR